MTADLIHFFTHNWLGQAIVILAQCLAVTIPLLVAVAYMTYADRKVWSRSSSAAATWGPSPFSRWPRLKLVLKANYHPSSANACCSSSRP